LLAATAIFFLAIRAAPIGKWAFVALALTPMALFESASLSSDALTNAFAFLLVGFLLRCACGPLERLSGKDVAILAVLMMALAWVKQGYLLLVLAYFLIPEASLGGRKRYRAVFALLIGCEILAAGGWALVVRDVYSPVVPGKIDPAAQLRHMVEHPRGFLLAVLRSSTVEVPGTLREYLGLLGVLDTPLSNSLLLLQGLVLVLTALMAFGPPGTVTGRQTLVALTTALVTYLSILTVIHITWDAVGSTDSIDVQGRYYIPLGPLVALGLAGIGQQLLAGVVRLGTVVPKLTAVAIPCLLAASLSALFQRYFVDDPLAAAERHFDQGQQILQQNGSKQEAQEEFEEAVRLNPQHATAHYNLGNLLAASRPREAITHYREAARLDPNNVQIHNNLANALARQGLFEEAIEHYKNSLQLAPSEEAVRKNLQNTQRLQDQLQRSLLRISSLIQDCAQGERIEKRYVGTPREAFCLKPDQGEVLTSAGTPPLPKTRYVWRVPPPSGEPIRAPLEKDTSFRDPARRQFYACSMDQVGLRRVFVFPPPTKAILLSD
jgi:tetratricopeptide (TPR) repeat protein